MLPAFQGHMCGMPVHKACGRPAAFWEHSVYVFNPGFLIATHRVAEKDTGSGQTIRTGLFFPPPDQTTGPLYDR